MTAARRAPLANVYDRALLWLARHAGMPRLRDSAFRKYCRRHRGQTRLRELDTGIRMRLHIGDSVDNQLFVNGEFEPETTRALEKLARHADGFIDVGCNIGYYSCVYARSGRGPIVAVDPNPEMVRRTRENLELNDARAEILQCGVGERRGTLTLNVPANRHSLASFAYAPTRGGAVTTLEVPIRTLSEIVEQTPLANALVKVDTEGFELQVLRGITAAAARRIGYLVMELSAENLAQARVSLAELLDAAALADRRTFRIAAGGRLRPASASELTAETDIGENVVWVRNDLAGPILAAFRG
ncbi:MAG TPA: FkbM family methyltransferase [Candidatus Binatia bacterium]|nr:FkbM family methyltransferase [Candidatus Binatia bacterium]